MSGCHRRRVHALRRALDGRWRVPRRVLGPDAGHRRAPRARPGLEMGGRSTRSAAIGPADPRPERPRAALLRSSPLIAATPSSATCAIMPSRPARRVRQPAVRRDHGRRSRRRGRRQRPPPDRLVARRDALRGRRAGRRSAALIALAAIALGEPTTSLKLGAGRRSTPRRVAMPCHRRSSCWPSSAAAFVLAGRLGFGPLAPPPAPDDPAAPAPSRPPPPPAAGCGPGSQLGLPVVWMVVLPARHPARASTSPRTSRGRSSRTTAVRRGWPPGHTGQTLLDLTGADVRLPQRPDRGARRLVAVVGLAVRPQAGLVLPGGLRRQHHRRDLRRRQPRRSGGSGVPAMGFVAWQAFTRRSLRAGPDRDRASPASGSRGRGSTGRRSSTTTTRACRS